MIKELFAFTLNRTTTARVRCVSSAAVVLNTELTDWLRREQTKKTTLKGKPRGE